MNAKQTPLRLVAEQSSSNGEADQCSTCDLKRQLAHVEMMLNAALLAVNSISNKPTTKKEKNE